MPTAESYLNPAPTSAWFPWAFREDSTYSGDGVDDGCKSRIKYTDPVADSVMLCINDHVWPIVIVGVADTVGIVVDTNVAVWIFTI